jgi:hypothetical protein
MIREMIVTPVPGTRLELVLQLLQATHTKASNLNNYRTPEEYLLSYLTWATEHSRLIEGQRRAKDVEALFFTPVYWALLSGAGHVSGRLAPESLEPADRPGGPAAAGRSGSGDRVNAGHDPQVARVGFDAGSRHQLLHRA